MWQGFGGNSGSKQQQQRKPAPKTFSGGGPKKTYDAMGNVPSISSTLDEIKGALGQAERVKQKFEEQRVRSCTC